MIWVTVSSWSCSCWLYRTSPSLAAKNIINLIAVLTIWWCPCVESSLVLLEECVCYDQCIFLSKLYYSLPFFIPYSKAKFACYSRYSLTSYFLEKQSLFPSLWEFSTVFEIHRVEGFSVVNNADVFFWNSLAFSMMQSVLVIWFLVPLPFLNSAYTSENSKFMCCWRSLS